MSDASLSAVDRVLCPCGQSVTLSKAVTLGRCPVCDRIVSRRDAPPAAGTAPDDDQAMSIKEFIDPDPSRPAASNAAPQDDQAASIKDFIDPAPPRAKSRAGSKAAGFVAPPASAPPPAGPPVSPMTRMIEALLDPRAIQYLLGLGGTLAVAGLVIFLYSVGLFDDPLVKAALFGVGTLGLLGLGWWIALATRYRTAGVALTALACAVAPLNLWFYAAQDLMTVQGHLWAAALVCCVLYAATLWRLREPVFLYAIQAGVTLTALLLLADLGRLTDAAALATTLVGFGLAAVHLELAFPPEDAAGEVVFGRRRYGRPLIYSGFGQIVAGLGVLFAAQVFGWMRVPRDLVTELLPAVRLTVPPVWAAGLWLAGAYAAFYAAWVPRLGGATLWGAAGCLLMAEVTVLAGTNLPAEAIVAVLAATAAAAVVAGTRLPKESTAGTAAAGAAAGLALLPVGLAYGLFLRATNPGLGEWFRPLDWTFPAAAAWTAACLYGAAVVARRQVAVGLQICAAAAVLLAAAGALRVFGGAEWPMRTAVLMLIPLGYLAYGLFARSKSVSAIAVGLLAVLVAHLPVAIGSDPAGRAGASATFWLAVASMEAAAFLLLAAGGRRREGQTAACDLLAVLAAAPIAAAVALTFAYFAWPVGWGVPVFAAIALALLVAAFGRFDGTLGCPAFACGVTLLLGGIGYVVFHGLGVVVGGDLRWSHFGDNVVMGLATLVGAVLAPNRAWRRGLFAASAAVAPASIILLANLLDLSGWQGLEIACVAGGLLLLGAGHAARFRESQMLRDDLVAPSFWTGGLMALAPLAIAVLWHRVFGAGPSLMDELMLVTVAVLLLATGVTFRVKATTLFGAGALAAYLTLLIGTLVKHPQATVGAYLAGAGVLLFLLGVGLSVYRERLKTLPEQFANREGVFRILDWR